MSLFFVLSSPFAMAIKTAKTTMPRSSTTRIKTVGKRQKLKKPKEGDLFTTRPKEPRKKKAKAVQRKDVESGGKARSATVIE